MLDTGLIVLFILLLPIIIPVIVLGIVKLCDSSSKNGRPQNYPQPNVYGGYAPNANYQFPAPPTMPAPPAPKKEKKHDMTVSNVLFLIGTAFVVLSGLAFGVAKWVHTTHEGRVAIIGAAALVSFLLSAVVGKFLKLSGTSTSFYILGTGFTATAILTAGFYELMGEWLSFSGDGTYALLAASAAVTTALLFGGCKLFKNLPLVYTALSSSALTVLFTVMQISSDLMINSLIFLVLEAFIIAALFRAKIADKSKYALPIKIVGSCAAFIYSLFPVAYILKSVPEPTAATYFIFAAIIGQLVYYGKKTKENVLISISSMVEIFLAYTFAKDIASTTSNRTGVLTFCALIFILYAIHRFVPLFKNAFTESVTLSVSIIATLICFCSASANAFIPEFITGVIASLIVASYVLHKNKVIQTFAGFKAPILPAVMTARASSMLAPALGIKDTAAVNTVCWSIFALILILAAALLVYIPKLSFAFHAEHQRKTDTALYVNMAVAGIILMALPFSGSLIFIPAALCFIHFAVSNKLPANITAVLPSLAFLGAISEFLKNNKADSLVTSIVIMSAFCVYMGISRLFYSSSVISSREGKITIDPMLFSGWLAPMLMYKELTRTSIFFAVIALAVYCAAFIKKNTSHTTASILLTITTALTSAALIFRPFFVPDSAAVSSKITLAIIAAAGLACRFIWNKYPEASRYSSQGIFLTAFIALLIDALYFDTALNTIFVMSVMLFVLIVSIMAHSKTWFTASAVSLFTITIYATREYLMALDWWIYLFLAGLTLIVLAAVNEYCKKNNETLKTSVARKFSGWTW